MKMMIGFLDFLLVLDVKILKPKEQQGREKAEKKLRGATAKI